ncbi:LAFA_0C09098g1_1 [Lachancea sp. 'fantastica']|nr:LAFA_0C09098g1_1 [Lachancea sp. 'fantastica']
MSFDWLNVPGLSSDDSGHIRDAESPPPPVSFDFGSTVGSKNGGLDRTNSSGGEEYQESREDLAAPLSLSKNQLSREEVRTYLRWYGYITSRKNAKLIRLDDIFRFMSNFLLSQVVKDRVEHIFKSCKNALNIGQFFAVLRLISRAMHDDVVPTRGMILHPTPVPKPKSILAAGNEEVYEEIDDSQDAGPELKVDFDSFASLLLTGQKKKRYRRKITNYLKKLKKVRFSDNLVTFQDQIWANEGNSHVEESEVIDDNKPLDLSLPMDQLLKNLAVRKKNSALVSKPPSEQTPDSQEEKEVLEDMKESLNHFQQLQKADTVAQNSFPIQSSTGNSEGGPTLEPLKPTATGSANYLFRSSQPPIQHMQQEPLRPTSTGSANHFFQAKKPADQNWQSQQPLQPLKPTATGSANSLFRSRQEGVSNTQHVSPNPAFSSPNLSKPGQNISTNSSNSLASALTPHIDGPLHARSDMRQAPPAQNPQLRFPDQYPSATNNYSLSQYQSSPQFPNTYRNETFNSTEPGNNSGFGMSPQTTNPNQFNFHFNANNHLFMSTSPSPNASTMQLNQPSNPGQFQPLQGSLSPMPGNSSGGGFPAMNHNGPLNGQPDRNYLHPSYTGPALSGYSNNRLTVPPRDTHSFSPSPVPQSNYFPQNPPNNYQSKDILGDLKALQAHVDHLQNAYNR